MYELKRISLHNWYLVDVLDIPIREHAALIGQTGAGKSSVLDAIQTVISGNNRNVLELNAAAGAQRGRSVRDYALGCVSDVNEGKPRRDRCETTLALTFHDKSLDRRLVLGLLLKAEQDLSEQTRRFLIEGCDFRIEDFVERGTVVSHDTMIERIRTEYGDKALSFHANSTRFVNAYLGYMRPSAPPDAKRFLRSFANALQAREMSDPTDFVRRFVLEPMPLDVAGVRSSISVWREMSSEVARIESMTEDLNTVVNRFKKGFQISVMEGKIDVAHVAVDHAEVNLLVRRLNEDIKAKQSELSRVTADLHQRESDSSSLAAEREGLLHRLKETDSSAELVHLDAERRLLEERKTTCRQRIEAGLQPFSELRHLNTISDTLPDALAIGKAGAALSAITSSRTPEEWVSVSDEIRDILNKIRTKGALLDVVSEEIDVSRQRMHELRSHIRDQDQEDETGKPAAVLSRHVRAFLSDLADADIGARCLPDLVTVNDQSWAFALEAILGANREAVMVDEKQLDAAFDLLYRNRDAYDGVRLIDQRRMRAMQARIAEDSIVEVVSAEDPVIQQFLEINVGRYSRAETEDELRRVSSGIMRNGKTGSGATLRVFRDRRPILGKTAQKETRSELAMEMNALREELEDRQRHVRDLEGAQQRLRAVFVVNIEDVFAALDDLRRVLVAVRSITQRRQAVSAPDLSDIEDRLANIDANLKTLRAGTHDIEKLQRSLDVQCGVLNSKLEEAEDRSREFAQRRSAAREEASKRVPESIVTLLGESEYDIPVGDDDICEIASLTVTEATTRIAVLRERLQDLQSEITKEGTANTFIVRGNNALMAYAQKWLIEEMPLGENSEDADRFVWAHTQLDRLKNHELLKYRERLERARDEMEASLTEGLIGRIGEQFALMDEQLDSLNRRLAKYAFVGQTYQFRSTISAQFLPIYRLVTADVSASGSVLDVADDESLEALNALLEGDSDDVRKYEDYRNYFNFELFIEHPDPGDEARIVSTPFSAVMGKLSGGQRQAPYYVAIAASLVSAYYPKAVAGDFEGMGLMVFDEAFNKLDIPNTQRLMDLFRSLGLQVIVAAPEEKRSSLIECVDSVISVSRIPGSADVFIDSVTIGPKTKERMLAENPVHRTAESYERARLAPGE